MAIGFAASNHCVYRIAVPGGAVYYGVSNDPYRRWCQHKSEANKPAADTDNAVLYAAIAAAGGMEACEFEVLAQCLPAGLANEMEATLIRRQGIQLLNLNQGLGQHSAQTRQKMSSAQRARGVRPPRNEAVTAAQLSSRARRMAQRDLDDPAGKARREYTRAWHARRRAKNG